MAKRLGMGNEGSPNGNEDGLSPLDDNFFSEDGDLDDENDADDYDDDDDDGDDNDDEDEYDDTDDADGEEGADGKPKKFAGMYDTVEQLEKAYKGLQTQYQSTKKSLYERLTGSQDTPPAFQARQAQPVLQPLDPDLVAQAMAENPTETMKLVMEYGAKMAESQSAKSNDAVMLKLEITDCRTKFKDFDQYSDDIAAVLEKNPEIMVMKNRMEVAYKLAKAENPQKIADKALKAGRQQGYDDARRKSKVNNTGSKSSNTKRTQPRTAEDSAVDDMMGVVKARGGFGL